MGELVFIGLGLYDERDLTVKGLEEARRSDVLFAELYTSRLAGTTRERIEKAVGKPVEVLTRQEVEQGDRVIDAARSARVGFLVPGDPMAATTHVALRLRAAAEGIATRVVHGVSIFAAAPGLLGLQHVKFGRATTLPLPEPGYRPESPYDVIADNRARGLHTLVLLDLKEDGRHLSPAEAIVYLLELEGTRRVGAFTVETLVAVVGGAGSDSPVLRADAAENLQRVDMGPPLHCLVVPGPLHFMEEEALAVLAGARRAVLERHRRKA